MIRLAFFWMFLLYFMMLILSLPLLGLGLVRRHNDTICWELDLISGFFAFSWLIVWGDGINKCG